MEKIDEKGIFYAYVGHNIEWSRYQYCIETYDGRVLMKADPYAFFSDLRPETYSKVYDIDGYEWHDDEWFRNKPKVYDQPLCVYEVHLGSWRRKDGEFMKFNEIAPQLIQYMIFSFTARRNCSVPSQESPYPAERNENGSKR